MTADIVAGHEQAAGAAAQGAARAATTTVDLCVQVTARQQSSEPGQSAQWSIAAWATGGNVPNAAIALQVSPTGTGTAQFSFGCGSGNGTSTCTLGTVDASSGHLSFQAQLTVPSTASATTVTLTATGSATGLPTGPTSSAPVAVTAPTTPVGGGATLPAGLGAPGATDPGATVSPAGGAGTLLPTVDPSANATTPTGSIGNGTRQVDNTTALPTGNNHVGVELVGLLALAAAFLLAVTRVSVRRPPGRGQGKPNGPAPPPAPGEPPSKETGGTE